jgi:hypothetical protein
MKAMNNCRLVCHLANFAAPSTDSAPLLPKKTRFSQLPGVSLVSFSAKSTTSRYRKSVFE